MNDRAAFFPTVTLFGEGGFASSALATLVSWPSRFWALRATLAETIFDGGRRRATVDQAVAEYDGTVASYRLTVLSALEQVEDALAALRILSRERQQQEDAVRAATAALARAEDGTASASTATSTSSRRRARSSRASARP